MDLGLSWNLTRLQLARIQGGASDGRREEAAVLQATHAPLVKSVSRHAPGTNAMLISVFFVLADVLVIIGAMGVAFWLRALLGADLRLDYYMHLLGFVTLFPVLYALSGLYPGYGIGPVQELRRLTVSTSVGYLLIASSSYLLRADLDHSRGFFFIAWAATTVALPLQRSLVRHFLSRTSWWGEPVIILGAGKTGVLVADVLTKNPGFGWRPVMLLDDDPAKQNGRYHQIPIAGGLEVAASALETVPVNHAVIAMPGIGHDRLVEIVRRYLTHFKTITVIPELFGLPTFWVTARDLNGILGLEVRNRLRETAPRATKRILDVAIASFLLVILAPVFGIIAVLIKVDSPGPVFYRHKRVGKGMRSFNALKFRTMIPDADKVLAEYLANDPDLRREWERDQKLKSDPRVTRVGKILRKLSLDELPQLVNVLRGEMSLVGPRPIVHDEIRHYGNAFDLYAMVQPGITGLWQVSGRNDVTYEERVRLDSYYVQNWSVWLDLYILARTIPVVLMRRGAY